MNKLKAVLVGICFILLYYIVRPVNCFFSALLESRLMNMGFFVEVFKYRWEETGDRVKDFEWIKELWNE